MGWSKKLTLALAQFYINLEGLKSDGYNPRALILYQAVVRKQWHEALKGRGHPFNISIINDELYVKLENQIRDRDLEDFQRQATEAQRQTLELQKQVSTISSTNRKRTNGYALSHLTLGACSPARPFPSCTCNATQRHMLAPLLYRFPPPMQRPTSAPPSCTRPQHSWRCCLEKTCLTGAAVTGTGEGRGNANEAGPDQDLLDRGLPKIPRNLGFGGPAQKGRRTPSPPARPASVERDTQYKSVRHPISGTVNARLAAPEPKTGESSTAMAARFALTGTKRSVAKTRDPSTFTNAQAVEKHHMAHRNALSQRRRKPLTPLVADQWQLALSNAHLDSKYPMIPMYIRQGAHAGIPRIQKSYTPLNKNSHWGQRGYYPGSKF